MSTKVSDGEKKEEMGYFGRSPPRVCFSQNIVCVSSLKRRDSCAWCEDTGQCSSEARKGVLGLDGWDKRDRGGARIGKKDDKDTVSGIGVTGDTREGSVEVWSAL